MFGKPYSVCVLLAAASTLVAAQNSTSNSTSAQDTASPAMLAAWDRDQSGHAEIPLNWANPASNSSTGSNSTKPFSNSTSPSSTSSVAVPLSTGTTGLNSSSPFANSTSPLANSTMQHGNSTSNSSAFAPFAFPPLNSTTSTPTNKSDPATNTTTDPSKPSVSAVDPRFPPITPCQEGAGPFHGCGKCVNSSAIAPVPLAKANLSDFDNSMFVSQDGSGGGHTWMSVPKVAEGCKVLFFGETPGMEPPHGVPGIMTAIASNEGCYFVNTGAKISVSFCCGNDECNGIGAGLMSAAPPAKAKRSGDSRPAQIAAPPMRRAVAWEDAKEIKAVAKRDDPIYTFFSAPNTYSATSNWVAPEVPQQWCEPAVTMPNTNDFYRAGFQQMTGNKQWCSGSFCSFSVDVTVTTSDSMDISGSVQNSEENGINVSEQFGYSMGPTALTTLGYDHSWTKAITNSTSFTNTTSHATGMTASLGVQPGTWAQLALVPQLSCKQLKSQCHNGTHSGTVLSEKCEPVMTGTDGKTPQYITYPVTLG